MNSDWRDGGRSRMSRRSFLGSGTLAGAGLLLGGTWTRSLAQDMQGHPMTAPVETGAGRIRGVNNHGVNQFWGVPYGASTAGSNRFMPPVPPEPWTGVRDAFQIGRRAPYSGGGPISVVRALDRQEEMGEDCLTINIFTPGLGAGSRPVMVWLHGGGFSQGSGNWLLYDGTNLARKEDVVVVAVNHRLNLFGFLHLADLGGEKWANSTNTGMQDIVAVLQWIRNNISNFGGNPNNVTVFGQSGGGSKVTTLMGMPSAKGLFHRAIAMSGSQMRGVSREDGTRAAEQFLARLGLRANQLEQLQRMPFEDIAGAFYGQAGIQALGTGPVVDGNVLPRHQFDPTAPADSATVPLMMGSTETENGWVGPPPLELSDEDMLTRFTRIADNDEAKGKELIALYKESHPDADNMTLWLILDSDTTRRRNAQTLGELKHAQGQAPSYLYYFNWYSPVYDGRMKSYHCLDIPFVLYNVDIAASMTGSGQDRYPLAHRMSAAWAAFARNGNPNHPDIPNWTPFNPADYPTMIFGNEVKLVNDPNRQERLALGAFQRSGGNTGE